MVTVLTVNYNTPDYLERLLTSFRKFYDTPYLVIDGSDKDNYEKIRGFDKRFGVNIIHFDYNIHHGPGMAYGINKITTDQILLADSDMIIHNKGWLEQMVHDLRPTSYGMGDIQQEYYLKDSTVRVATRNPRVTKPKTVSTKMWVDYLHPAFALVNKKIVERYPMPIKGGAPLIPAMKQIALTGQSTQILQRAVWLTEDLWLHTKKYVQHNENHEGMGTVVRTGGYNLA
jgi:glycosyltransferase involved in cell wall biosynthesis